MEDLDSQIQSSETLYEGSSRKTFLKYFLFLVAMATVFGLMLVNVGKQVRERDTRPGNCPDPPCLLLGGGAAPEEHRGAAEVVRPAARSSG